MSDNEEIEIISKGKIYKINDFGCDDYIAFKERDDLIVITRDISCNAINISLCKSGERINSNAELQIPLHLLDKIREIGTYEARINDEKCQKCER
jgi:hypothetical protein